MMVANLHGDGNAPAASALKNHSSTNSRHVHARSCDRDTLLYHLSASIRLRKLSAVRAKKIHTVYLAIVENYGDSARCSRRRRHRSRK